MHSTFVILIVLSLKNLCSSQPNRVGSAYDFRPEALKWCTISQEEQRKCLDWAHAIRDLKYQMKFDLQCELATGKDQCLNMISSDRAHLTTLDPGDVFIGGRHHSLVPIMTEFYGNENGYYSVAVVKKISSSYILSPLDLRNMRACFPGVGSMAGWIVPMAHLLDEDLVTVKDCNNMVKTAANFFNSSCAPNSLIDKHNPSGDNPHSMCELCSNRCSGTEPYMNFDGAFKCLVERGDVAFLKHTTVEMMLTHYSNLKKGKALRNDFELLCPKGGRAGLSNFRNCNWGFIPAHAVVTVSSVLPEKRQKYQEFLMKSVVAFTPTHNQPNVIPYQGWQSNNRFANGTQQTPKSFVLFGDTGDRYGDAVNLLFSDETTNLVPIDESKQTFSRYLSTYMHFFDKLRKCPVPSARLCVVSSKEFEKCNLMRAAFASKLLKPDLACVVEHSSVNCMKAIQEGYADLTVLDAGDIYKAGQMYNLMPIVSEQYDLEEPSYYVVAIAKQSDKDTDLLYLKGRRSCHTGYNKAAGWVMPMSFLLTNNRVRSYGCDSPKAASEFFQKSCVPGVLSSDYGSTGWSFANLCDLCHGSSSYFCSRSAAEPFYGDTGALRCLVEGGGHIAFAKHTTILENTGYRNPSWWSRNVIPDDFELLCRDGSRAKHSDFEKCNLGKVAANAIMTSKDRLKEDVDAYVNLFMIAQQLYGSKFSEDYTFKMFQSEVELHDLIFNDATTQLKIIPEHKRNHEIYLGHEFMKSMRVVDCTAGAAAIKPILFVTVMLTVIRFFV